MSRLDCRWISLRTYALATHGAFVVIFLAAALCASSQVLEAAPITLRFDAIVGPPRQGVDGFLPPSWNVSLKEGDLISGTFTYEPFDAAPNVSKTTLVQPFDFSIHIKDRTLTTSQYRIEVYNNFVSDENPESTDNINLDCSFLGGPVVCTPISTSPGEPIKWAFGVAMFGDSTALDGADIPIKLQAWQGFRFYDMGVSFFDPQAHRFYGFLATPRSFDTIPEPNTLIIVLLGNLVIVLARNCFLNTSPSISNRS